MTTPVTGDATQTRAGGLTITRHTFGRYAIQWDGTGAGTGTLTRTTTKDGRTTTVTVAGGAQVPLGVADVWIDGDVPLGPTATVTYRLGGATVTVPGINTNCREVISDPISGLSAWVDGSGIDADEYPSATTAAWLHVTPGGQPLVHARPEQAPVRSFDFYTQTREDREVIDQLCRERKVLLARSPAAGIDDLWFTLVGNRVVSWPSDRHPTEAERHHAWSAYLLDRPDPATSPRHGGDTLGALHSYALTLAADATMQTITDEWGTLAEVAIDTLTPEARR